jgi:undecaprenyl diphosphate synthase
MQSSSHTSHLSAPLLHVAIVMDGNGRWATARGRPRTAGHLAGARTARTIVETAARLGVGTLTLYAFSADNWRRPPGEVAALLRLFRRYLAEETARCVANGVRLTVLGRRDRIPARLADAIETAERTTAAGRTMRLRLAIDYSARDAILQAAAQMNAIDAPDHDQRTCFASLLAAVHHDPEPAPDVDLLIRTGGERRLSDFLLWECAYAELWFTDTPWPDFGPGELARAIADFAARDRRFGRVSTPSVRAAS